MCAQCGDSKHNPDDANPAGMPRPRIKTTHRGYVEPTPTRKRPMLKTKYAVGEGNNPEGMKRPSLKDWDTIINGPVDPSTEVVMRALREG
jgi:hypothetical protein